MNRTHKILKQRDQNGQALLAGLIFLLIVLFFSAYFLFVSEAFFRQSVNQQRARDVAFVQATQVANTLDRIAINNQSIIAAISVAQTGFAEALELGLYLGHAEPYWETYRSRRSLQKSAAKRTALSSKAADAVLSLYKAFSLRSARGLFLAKSLSEKNKELVATLPPQISRYFTASQNRDVFCLALETQRRFYQKPGFFNVPGVELLYSFFLEKKGCALEHRQPGFYEQIDQMIPLLSSSEPNQILSYADFDQLFSFSNYGISYVPFFAIKNFLNSLIFFSPRQVKPDSQFTTIARFLGGISFFKDLSLDGQEKISKFPQKIKVRISHPDLICLADKESPNNIGDFLDEKDWTLRLPRCVMNKDKFLRSFFMPRWAAILTERESDSGLFKSSW